VFPHKVEGVTGIGKLEQTGFELLEPEKDNLIGGRFWQGCRFL
jgi:hypothetical protein